MGPNVPGLFASLQIQVKLLSSDQQVFDVDEDVAFMSETIKNTLEGGEGCALLLVFLVHAGVLNLQGNSAIKLSI